jgi:hypothetical protein
MSGTTVNFVQRRIDHGGIVVFGVIVVIAQSREDRVDRGAGYKDRADPVVDESLRDLCRNVFRRGLDDDLALAYAVAPAGCLVHPQEISGACQPQLQPGIHSADIFIPSFYGLFVEVCGRGNGRYAEHNCQQEPVAGPHVVDSLSAAE